MSLSLSTLTDSKQKMHSKCFKLFNCWFHFRFEYRLNNLTTKSHSIYRTNHKSFIGSHAFRLYDCVSAQRGIAPIYLSSIVNFVIYFKYSVNLSVQMISGFWGLNSVLCSQYIFFDPTVGCHRWYGSWYSSAHSPTLSVSSFGTMSLNS